MNEEYITQVSEEIDGGVTKKLSNEFSWTSIRILGALSKPDEFLQNQHVRVHSGTVPGTFRNMNIENRETTMDRSQNNPCPEVDASFFQTVHSMNSDRGDTTHKIEGVHEEIPYCSPWDFCRKTKEGTLVVYAGGSSQTDIKIVRRSVCRTVKSS